MYWKKKMKNLKNIVCFIVLFMFYASVLWGQTGRLDSLQTNALTYLYQKTYQILGPEAYLISFLHLRTEIDEFDYGHSRFRVLYKGIPIFANVIIVHFDQSDNATWDSGDFPDADFNLSVEPDLTANKAIEIVRNQMDIGAQTNLMDTTLMIWDGKLIDPSFNSINLVWKVEMMSSSPPGEWIYFIDAHTGDVVNFYNNRQSAGLNQENYNLESFRLYQNYPNPFNLSTTIEYEIFKDARVILKIVDINGKELSTLVNDYQPSGKYSISWDSMVKGITLPSGVYFYQIQIRAFKQTKKMLFLK